MGLRDPLREAAGLEEEAGVVLLAELSRLEARLVEICSLRPCARLFVLRGARLHGVDLVESVLGRPGCSARVRGAE